VSEARAARAPRRRPDGSLLLLVPCVAILYGPLLPELVADWSRGGDFSHGFAVPLVAAALVWTRRAALRDTPIVPWLPGAGLLLLAVFQYLVGVATSEFFLQRSSLVVFLGGWLLLTWGRLRARRLLFPTVFLIFMVPPPSLLWSSLSLPLQLLASRLATGVLGWLQVEVTRHGNVLQLGTCSLEVAAACSGLRSLVALLLLASVLAEGSLVPGRGPRTAVGRAGVLLAAVPIAVLVNAARVTTAALLAAHRGADLVDRFHGLSGFLLFAVALVLLAFVRGGIRWIEDTRRG
jgi:exosortase